MEIIKARKEHLEQLMEIENECFIEPFKKENIEYELFGNAFSYFYIAIEEEKVIGFIDFWITFDSSTICQIAVRKQYRNKGVASSLINMMFDTLKQNEVSVSTLEVRSHNESAIKFYLKHGYFKEVLKRNYYTNGDDAIYMIRGIV